MLKKWKIYTLILTAGIYTSFGTISHAQSISTDPLPSWNEGQAKQALINFVHATTNKTNSKYIAPEQRIAAFDQDGTLWVEHPMYTQVIFAFDRVIELAAKHPEWKTTEPFKSIIADDKKAMAKFTLKDLEKILLATHTDMTVEEFAQTVKTWLGKAKHPRFHKPYTDLVYQPMLEVLNFLRTNQYKIYIVTGGGQEFVRVYAEKIYGVPPEQVIGSALQTKYGYNKQNKAILTKIDKPLLDDNYSGKPEDIYLFIGRKPFVAFGNSTGDQQMLEYTESNKPTHLMLLIHHDDAEREYDYGPDTKIGTFSAALMNEANKNNWLVVSMKKDWKRIFAFEN